jgi:3-methyl-2-oxobutanoate hydroxymethyltransferase
VPVPTIGIGAGRHCDGQVLVWHDILGFEAPGHRRPKFVRAYAEFERDASMAIERFCSDVRAGTFPSSAETYHMTDRMAEALGLYGATGVGEPELTQ